MRGGICGVAGDEPARDAVTPEQSDDLALGVAAVARRLGVATGNAAHLGPPLRRRSQRRTGPGLAAATPPRDLARLALMRRLMLEGVSAGEAAGRRSAPT